MSGTIADEAPPLGGFLSTLLARLAERPCAVLENVVTALVQATGEGHVCLPLEEVAGSALLEWRRELLASGLVGAPGEFRPLILDAADRLYLHRLWSYEKSVGDAILSRLQAVPLPVDEQLLTSGLDRLFGEGANNAQRRAAEAAVRNRVTIISGGPGTGKTRTVLTILALLLEQSPAQPPKLALVAPTGKASARLRDSIQAALGSLPLSEELRGCLPSEAQTIHRLLKNHDYARQRAGQSRSFLPLHGVLVDEASMVDLGLLARLFRALPPTARIIMLGDRYQLASVEAGAAFGDLCQAGKQPAWQGSVVELRKSFRFSEDSGIFQISRAVQAGDAAGTLAILRAQTLPDVAGLEYTRASDLAAILRQEFVGLFRQMLVAGDPAAALAALGRFRILCALRHGPTGVAGLNALLQRMLEEDANLQVNGEWFAGRPILITQNDYEQCLFNGESGICWPDAEAGGELRIFFAGDQPGQVRRFLPGSLPPHETAFAMTVHRSQGSEFDQVLVILPQRDAPVLSRELLYTAITRAREKATVCYVAAVLQTTVERRVLRTSGLQDRFG